MRHCYKCKQDKPGDQFMPSSRHNICLPCNREQNRARYAREKAAREAKRAKELGAIPDTFIKGEKEQNAIRRSYFTRFGGILRQPRVDQLLSEWGMDG